jgi:vancomycin resistance protein YoaR
MLNLLKRETADPGQPAALRPVLTFVSRLPSAFRSRAGIGLVAAVIAAILAYAVPALAQAGQVPPRTRVGGVDIGGLSPAAAEARLRRELSDEAVRPITVVVSGRRIAVDPAEAGLSLDARATVAAAGHGVPSPAGLVRSLFGGRREVTPRVSVNEGRLAGVVDRIAATIDRPRREGYVRYAGTRPIPVPPRTGHEIDRTAAANAIRAAFLSPRHVVTVSPRAVSPTVPADRIRHFAATTARTAVARPVILTRRERTATLAPAAIARHLRFVPDGTGGLRPEFDAAGAVKGVERRLVDAAKVPRDATFEVVRGRLRLVPARTGEGVDTGRLAQSMSAVLAGGAARADRTVVVEVASTPPRITTEQAQAMGIEEKISSFTTRHPCCAPRVTNIHRIADIVDGYIVKPGETFSLNGIVGKRDKARGFVEAPMILNNRFVNDVGGGVSQFATTMFNAVFFGGLADVQHTPHIYYISRYPAGRESTVSFPQPDFRWRNDSPYGVLIKTAYTGTSITVTFWSTKRFDIESESSPRYDVHGFETSTDSGPDCIPMPGAEGFTIDVWRVFKRDGQVVRKQRFHTVYQPEPRLICSSTPGSGR